MLNSDHRYNLFFLPGWYSFSQIGLIQVLHTYRMHKIPNEQEAEYVVISGWTIIFLVPLSLFCLWSRKWNLGPSKPQFNCGSWGRVADLKWSPVALGRDGWSLETLCGNSLWLLVSECTAKWAIGLGSTNTFLWMLLKTLKAIHTKTFFIILFSIAKLTP